MARTYSDEERSGVYHALTIYDGNVKRTARSTGVPEQTVRDWKKHWEKEPPSAELVELGQPVTDEFLGRAIVIRDKAMGLLEQKIEDGDVSARDLITTIGVTTDKIRLIQGQPTSRNETVSAVDPKQLGKALVELAAGAIEAAQERAADIDVVIEDAEIVEQAELESGTPH